jgi:toxin-antitoxin system PIN domain toxin
MPSRPEKALLDVNVVIAALFADHPNHQTARQFVLDLATFLTSPTVQGGFLRFATRPWKNARGEEQPPRLSMAQALSTLQQFRDNPRHEFLADDLEFTRIGLRSMQGHRQWTDAYLLRLSREHGVALASLENRMANLDDPATPSLFVVR